MASIVSAGTTSATALNMSADTSGVLQLASNNGTVSLTVDTSQNIQIGTTTVANSATDVLTVGKNSTSNDASLVIRQFGNGTAAGLQLIAANDTGAAYNQIASSTSGGTQHWRLGGVGGFTGGLAIATSGSERMRIDLNGRAFFNTTTEPGSNDSVVAIKAGGTSKSRCLSLEAVVGTSVIIQTFRNTNGQVGYIETVGSATAYVTSSDYRLKNTVAPMTGALAKVALLKPVTYKWNVDGSDGEGFIAHELAEVAPQCVSGEKDAVDAKGNPQYQGIDTSFLVATLTAAIQELNAKVTSLEEQVLNLGVK